MIFKRLNVSENENFFLRLPKFIITYQSVTLKKVNFQCIILKKIDEYLWSFTNKQNFKIDEK